MFDPMIVVFDEMAFLDDAEQCYGAVYPVAKQIHRRQLGASWMDGRYVLDFERWWPPAP